jgi:small subunit ribosomal protein S3Ae
MAKATVKKRWIQILAPKVFNNVVVGEISTVEIESVLGRTMKANLFTLTNEMRQQGTEINLLLDKAEGDSIRSKIIGLKMLPNSIKRKVRKGKTRIDQTLKAISKDEQAVVVKVIVITRNRIKGGVHTAIQNEIKQFMVKKITKNDYDAFSTECVTGSISKEMRSRLKKKYPLKICDIREFKLLRFIKAADLKKIKAEMTKKKEVKKEVEEEDVEEKKDKEEQPKEKTEEKKEEVTEKKEEKPEEVKEEKKAD